MTGTGTSTEVQRRVALALLVVAGLLSLPVVAAFLDGDSTDKLIVPVQLVLMAALGAAVGYLVPSLGGTGSSRARSVGVGVVVGVVAALIAVVVFFLLLDGV